MTFRNLPAVAIVGLALAALQPAAYAAPADETCQGKTATLVGSWGSSITGTPVADVVVTNGATDIDTLAGDDTVCVTVRGAIVRTGDGNDSVDATTLPAPAAVTVTLGLGADTFTGSPGADTVNAGDSSTSATAPADAESDVVNTGAGNDQVTAQTLTGGTGDQVDLGIGNDIAFMGRGSLAGGDGRDLLVASRPHPESLSGGVHINATSGITIDAAAYLPWTSIERLHASFVGGEQTYVGTTGDDYLTLGAVVRVRGLDGDDDVTIGGWVDGVVLSGGPGEDRLRIETLGRVTLDPGRHLLAAGSEGIAEGIFEGKVRGFDNYLVAAHHVHVRGTSNAEEILVGLSCSAEVLGRGGADLLSVVGDYNQDSNVNCSGSTDGRRHRLFGGAGRDKLSGGDLPDVLIGGPGRDTAFGNGGIDVCSAERETYCER